MRRVSMSTAYPHPQAETTDLGALPRRQMPTVIGSDPLDVLKPYVPWVVGLAFVGLLVYSGRRTPSPKRRRSRATTRRR
jgi:hypothetical protein